MRSLQSGKSRNREDEGQKTKNNSSCMASEGAEGSETEEIVRNEDMQFMPQKHRSIH